MGVLLAVDVHYLPAAVIATEVTILTNFAMTERWVFRDLRHEGRSGMVRFLQFFAFNNAEALLRLPVLVFLVEFVGLGSVLAQAFALAVAFLIRFVFVSQVIYRPRRAGGRHALDSVAVEREVAAA